MYKKDFNARVKEIKDVLKEDHTSANTMFESLVNELAKLKKNQWIVELANIKQFSELKKTSFDIAFNLKDVGRAKEAEIIYRNILLEQPNNVSVLNNLAIIVEEFGNIKESFDLIYKGYSLIEEDEIVEINYNRIKLEVEEMENKDRNFRIAANNVKNENSFVRSKLDLFFSGVKDIANFDNVKNTVPIPNWQFNALMKTDEEKANSLKKQWIDKGYLNETNSRNEYRVMIYEINPYIKDELEEISLFHIEDSWFEGMNRIEKEYLHNIGYFDLLKKINKVKKKFRDILLRDFNEFIINYIFCNNKSVIVLAGSLVETLLIYYLEKNKIQKISYQLQNKQVTKNIYDAQLGDLINFMDEKNIIGQQIMHLGNITRLYRNYIHPGKELRDSNDLDTIKSEICFNSVSELIKDLIH